MSTIQDAFIDQAPWMWLDLVLNVRNKPAQHTLGQITSQRAGAPVRPRYHPEEGAARIQTGAVAGWGVRGLRRCVYRKRRRSAARLSDRHPNVPFHRLYTIVSILYTYSKYK